LGMEYKEWYQQDKALREICTEVAITISTSLIPLIQNDATSHARLIKLKSHLAPSDPTRKRELRVKYDALRSPKPRNTSVDKWLDEWISVTDLMALLDMPETKGGQIQEDFLVTANKSHETWATAELRRLLELMKGINFGIVCCVLEGAREPVDRCIYHPTVASHRACSVTVQAVRESCYA
jgi:hypothetical protein